MNSIIDLLFSRRKKKSYKSVNLVCAKHLILKWDITNIKIDLLTSMEEMENFLVKQLEKWTPTEILLEQIQDNREENGQIIIRAFVTMERQCKLQLHTKVCFKGVVPEYLAYKSTSFMTWISEYPNEEKNFKIQRNYDLQYSL